MNFKQLCLTNYYAMLLVLVLSITPISVLANNPSIMVLGDSISAAYGIPVDQGWVKLLESHLKKNPSYSDYSVINASISGETTGGALLRLPNLLQQLQPSIVIIELGGNDGLNGFPITTFRDNLNRLISLSQAADVKVLLTGMHIPPNYGNRYTTMFYASYGLAADKYQLPLVPFLLENIATIPELMQRDGIHPKTQAQDQILQNVLPFLKGLL